VRGPQSRHRLQGPAAGPIADGDIYKKEKMLRIANANDIPALKAVRNSVQENALSDPANIVDSDYRWFVANPGVVLWEENGEVVGFSAADPRNGSIWALFVSPGYEGRGIGSALLARSCESLKSVGLQRAWLTTDPGTRAERFYLAAGWTAVGRKSNEVLFERTL